MMVAMFKCSTHTFFKLPLRHLEVTFASCSDYNTPWSCQLYILSPNGIGQGPIFPLVA